MRKTYYVTYAPDADEVQRTLRAAREQARTLATDERTPAVIYEVLEIVEPPRA